MNLLDILNAPWAITPDKLLEIQAVYERRVLAGDRLSAEEIEAAIGKPVVADRRAGYEVMSNGVGVINVSGALAKRLNLFSAISGGTSMQMIGNAFEEAMSDPQVRAIVLSIDSPGGTVAGTQELAGKIMQARGQGKEIVAVASGLMASAAYWIGSAADKIYITDQTTNVGSIGVVATHVDVSKREEQQGVKTTEITAGKYKRIASSYEPLTKEGKSTIQAQVDYLYSVFINDVAAHRGVSVDKVLSDMADARIFIGQQAVDAGLVDGIESFDSVVARLGNPRANIIPKEMAVADQTFDQAAVDAAVAAAKAEAHAAGVAEGRASELARVQGILEIAVEGHDDLIAAAINDGKSDAAAVALSIVKVQKERGVSLQSIRNDAEAPFQHQGSGETNEAAELASMAKLIAGSKE